MCVCVCVCVCVGVRGCGCVCGGGLVSAGVCGSFEGVGLDGELYAVLGAQYDRGILNEHA